MIPSPDYEEKQYENSLNQELTLRAQDSAAVISSGQGVELLLGYDAAIAIPHMWLWHVLGAPAPPGIELKPGLWQGSPVGMPPLGRLPAQVVSLVLQYK